MTTKREQFANNARNTLNGSLTNVATSVILDSVADFPTDGNFRILIDSEIMLVTSISGSTFTVVRGQEGTTGVTHDDGALVTQLITNEGIRQVIADDLLYANNKPLYHSLTNASGAALTASSFTWLNQGTATATDLHDTIYYTWPGDAGANQGRGHLLAVPGSTPYTVTIGFRSFLVNNDVGTDGFPQINLGIRDSSSGRIVMLAYHHRDGSNGFEVVQMTNNTTFSSTVFTRVTTTCAADMWMRIVDTGTNHEFKVSNDGVNWVTLLTQGRTAWTATPDQFYFGNDPAGTSTAGSSCALFHYSVANSAL
jgi:hypothetical protein